MKNKIVVIASAVVVAAIVLVLVLGKSLYRSGDTVGEELPLTGNFGTVTDTIEEVSEPEEVAPETEEDNITYISLTASYDKDDESSLQRGMCTEVNDADEEKDRAFHGKRHAQQGDAHHSREQQDEFRQRPKPEQLLQGAVHPQNQPGQG